MSGAAQYNERPRANSKDDREPHPLHAIDKLDVRARPALSPIPEIIDELKAGRMVILVDEEDRENEGDLVVAADCVTPEIVNFMARFGRGLICMPITEERARQLDLTPMTPVNRSVHGTNFTVSIEAREGVDHRHLGRRPRAHDPRRLRAERASAGHRPARSRVSAGRASRRRARARRAHRGLLRPGRASPAFRRPRCCAKS